MTRRLTLIALVLVAAATAGCAAMWETRSHGYTRTRVDTGIGFYYDDLAPYGTWVNVATYGWVWSPLDTPAGWRPYTVGYWIYTDDGWYWVSEDPWGWTPYHYGRWAWDYDYGWIWVPGDVWAPAWVAWRCSGRWIAWAPLPPDVQWRAGIGLMYSDYDLDRHIDRYHWCFTRTRDFGTTRERVKVEPSSRNVTLIERTKNVTKYVAGPNPREEGMRPDLIRREGQPPIERYRIIDSKTPIREKGVTIREGAVEIYRPGGGVTEVVRERVKNVPPAERPVPSAELKEKVVREGARLDEEVKTQREQLAKEQEAEMKEREPGASAIELKRRQEAELRAQREVEAQQKRVIEERERRVVKEREAPAQRETPSVREPAPKPEARDSTGEKVKETKEKVREQNEKQPEKSTRERGGR